MLNKKLQDQLKSYSALGATFLALAPHEAEAQIVYVDLPDQQYCTPTISAANNATGDLNRNEYYRFLHLDMDGQELTTGYIYSKNPPGTASDIYSGSFTTNPDADVLFIANVWLANIPSANRNNVSAGIYGYNNSWGTMSNFMGTASSGYIRKMNPGETVGSTVARGTNGWGVMPVFTARATATSTNTSGFGDPNWINGTLPHQTTGYVGVAFDISGNTHYGWIQIMSEQSLDTSAPGGDDVSGTACVTILDYAYNATPDAPITIGQTITMQDASVPTLSEWGMITLCLFLLTMGTIYLGRARGMLSTGHSIGVDSPFSWVFQRPPFYADLFKKSLLLTGMLSALMGAFSIIAYGGITAVDFFGTMVAGPIFAYMMHLLMAYERETKRLNNK